MLNLMNIWVIKKHDQNSRDVFNNYKKWKTKKTISTDNGKIDIQVPREQLLTFEPKIAKKHERNISRIKDQNSRRLWFKSCSQLTSNIKSTNYIIHKQIVWYKIVVIKWFKR